MSISFLSLSGLKGTMLETAADRLRYAMKEKGFATAADLARRMEYKDVTVRAHLNQVSGIPSKRAEEYARVLGVTPEWILYGSDGPLELPADDYAAALTVVEYAQKHSSRHLLPEEKVALVGEFRDLIARVRGK